jgi:cell division protein WhiA
MSFASDVKSELLELKMWDVNSNMKQDEQLARVYIREAFIKSGSINDPTKKYHLQIMFKTNKKAEQMQQLLLNFNIHAKIIKKDTSYMLYIKDGEEISEFLALVGANKSVIKYEEVRVLKEKRNDINRLVNCETANLNKTISAAVKQIEDIKYIKDKGKFLSMPENLIEIANLRVENPDISLAELGKLLKEPIGKSGVNHRLKKISEIAKELR